MVNKSNNDKKSVLTVPGTLFVLFILAAIMTVAASGCGMSGFPGGLAGKEKHEEVSFFMENDHGTYNLVELSIPSATEQYGSGSPDDHGADKFPVVLMAHGFGGTLHSGGASELGARLAERGVLAVRIDFDPYVEPSRSAARTHEYPLSQMRNDAVKLLGIVTREYGGDQDRISLYGRSYGGRLMMQMANESAGGYDYKKLALVAPAGDAVAFRRYLGGDEQYASMKEQAYAAEEKQTHDGGKELQDETAGKAGGASEIEKKDDSAEKTGNSTEAAKDSSEGGVSREAQQYPQKLGVNITPRWFEDVESYDPTEYGWKFGDKPVLLFYNTLDTVVYPDTSVRCAESYKNHEIVEVTTEDGHGYEMGYKRSDLKDRIMDRLVNFLAE